MRLGRKYGIPAWTVASFNHNIQSDHHVTIGSGQVRCINPAGREYLPENIDFMLEERELKAKYRRGGGRTRGPKKRTASDDADFAAGLEVMLSR